jgi:DnaA-homolog protein
MEQLALDLSTAPAPSLSNFESRGNEQAFAQLTHTVAELGEAPTPVLLWGETGCGKSHLLRAVAAALEGAGLTVAWLDEHTTQAPAFDEAWGAVLFDNCDGWDATQQATAFNWLVSAQGSAQPRKPWVLATSATPPADWLVRDDLRTRLAQGLVFELQVLNEDQRLQVLRQEAKARGLSLSDEVVSFMVRRFSRDLGSLMALLAHLDNYALRHQRALTVPLIKSMLEHE